MNENVIKSLAIRQYHKRKAWAEDVAYRGRVFRNQIAIYNTGRQLFVCTDVSRIVTRFDDSPDLWNHMRFKETCGVIGVHLNNIWIKHHGHERPELPASQTNIEILRTKHKPFIRNVLPMHIRFIASTKSYPRRVKTLSVYQPLPIRLFKSRVG